MTLPSLTPGIVESVDRERREVRVRIPGQTDNAELQPLAEILYAVGDKSEHTEIRILPGDRVWLAFINGDPRYPVIMGFRPKHVDNEVGTRRWHHENIETDADDNQKHTAGKNYEVNAGELQKLTAGTTYDIEAGTSITLKVGESTLVIDGSSATLTTESFTVDAAQTTLTGELRVDKGVSVGMDVVTDAGISHNNHPHTGNLGAPTSPPLPG